MGMIVKCEVCYKESEIEEWKVSRKYKKVNHLRCPECDEINGARMLHGDYMILYRIKAPYLPVTS